jgi:hypothetical protein
MSSSRFFSVDSPKAVKAQGYGYLNAINYMAPASTAGVGNLCPHASAGCLALCLGWYSGQAGMLANDKLETGTNAARASRQRKAREFMNDRATFMSHMVKAIYACERQAKRRGLKLCVRLNGATDIGWEGIRIDAASLATFPIVRDMLSGVEHPNVFAMFPHVQFVDYTKSVKRALRCATDKTWPSNYHLTFSRSETNEAECLRVLEAGGNVAVVFGDGMPSLYAFENSDRHWRVVDGDKHDLRHLDPKGGVIIGLSPKGRKAKSDTSGFVVRL